MWFSLVCFCLFLGLQTQIHQLSLCRPPRCDFYTPKTVLFQRGVSNLGVCAFFCSGKKHGSMFSRVLPPKNNTRVTAPADSANHATLVSASRELGQGWKTHLQGQERKVLLKSGRMRVCNSSNIFLGYLRVLVAPTPKMAMGLATCLSCLSLGPWCCVEVCYVQFQDALALSLPSACWNSTSSQYSLGLGISNTSAQTLPCPVGM